MAADLLHALKVLTELVVQTVGQELGVGSVDNVLTTIEKPLGDTMLKGVLHNGDDALQRVRINLTSALGNVNTSLAADEGGEAAANTLDGSEGVNDLLGTLNVGV